MSDPEAHLMGFIRTLRDTKSADGSPFDIEDVAHFARYLMVSIVARAQPTELEPAVLNELGTISRDAGAAEGDSNEEVRKKLNQFFTDRPPSPELLRLFSEWQRDVAKSGGEMPSLGSLAALASESKLSEFKGDVGKPESPATSRGPFAQFLNPDLDNKKK